MLSWKKVILSGFFVFLCLFYLQGCKRGDIITGLNAEGILINYTDCKTFNTPPATTEILSSSESGKECIEYDYDGSTLQLKHVNAAFNCCLDQIVAVVTIDGDVITIAEEGKLANGSGCHCICLYDLEFLITHLKPGVYTFVIPSFTDLIQIDLRLPTSNSYCEKRDRYPWN